MEETVKILVVDDDEVDRMAVKRSLKNAGVAMEWSEATGCASAISILQQQTFDCIFLDYLLPDGNGLELVRQFRSLGISTPIVVLTGQGDERIAVEVMKAGAYDYLPKSRITPENLYQILRQAVRLYRAEQAAILAGERLRESEERYRLVLEGANDGIWDWYCSTDEVYCNDRLLEIIGEERSQFDLTPHNLMARMHPDDVPKIRQAITNHLQHGEKCEAEFRIMHSLGEYRYCVARGKAQRDRFGCPLRMSGIISDITESKQLESALRASELRFRRLADANIIGIIVTDAQGTILEANQAFLEMVGYSQEDLRLGRLRSAAITPPEYQKADEQAATELRARGVFSAYEKEYIHPNNSSRVPVLIGGALVQGVVETAICFVIDQSPRKRSDAKIGKLNRSLERRVSEMQTLLDVIPIGIAIAQDPQCQHIRANPALAKLLSLPVSANFSKSAPIFERPFYKVYSQGRELEAQELPMQQATAKGVDVVNSEIEVLASKSKKIKLLANAVPLFDEQGKTRGSVGVFWDITERKRIEEQERFLAEASAILATSLDSKTTLTNLAMAIVSGQADWCTIDVFDENSTLRSVASTHKDSSKMPLLEQLRSYRVNLKATAGVSQVIKSGKAKLYSEVSPAIVEAIFSNAEQKQLIENLGFNSLMCVPLKVRGRTVGAISFIRGTAKRLYDEADLLWAEDLAHRAALAVDNARLYQQATDIGENLRRAIIILGEQQQQLRVLQRITNLLNQRLTNLPGLLQVMVGSVCDGIGEAEFAAISLYHSRSQKLELTATAGIEPENLELFSAHSDLLKRVFSTGTAQLVKKSKASSPLLRAPASIYAVAIESAASGRLGVLLIGNWRNTDAFDVEDRNLLEAVGEQAAIAINNARLINTLEEREERLGLQNEILAQQNRELESTHNQIAQQNLQLIEAARLKSQFLATMSHELRTPMNAVIGFAQVLLRQRTADLTPTQVDMVERILNNGKNLLALINDILDLSKIEAGRLELKQEEFDLMSLIAATIAELRPLAEQKHLLLHLLRVGLDSLMIINDSTRVRQILVNLLSNAIKFTSAGSVEVKVSEIAPAQVLISVKDTGVGIAQSELEHIFEEFRQVDQTTTRQQGGTGLGLAITSSLVSMMKGSITVETKLGIGSTFHVLLPRYIEVPEPPITLLK